ncbi:MAG: hypothetical protein HBSIN02_19020 [Bacteroidia bacterium]|nr:MAG: hypothetical protein HBSIN02_19020 [Bacteroidia bacterium]
MRWLLILLFLGVAAQAQDTKENADFKLAVSLYNDKLYDLAVEQFQQFISTYPNTQQGIEARFYLGLTQAKLNRHEEARFTFQNFALAFPDHPKAAEAWLNVAEAYVQLGNNPEAALAFERVKTFHPKSPLAPQALLLASRYFLASGDVHHAKNVLRVLTQEYASSDVVAEGHARLAQLYFDTYEYERAAAEARKCLSLGPRPSAFAVLAQSLAQLGKIEEAQGVLNEVISRFKTDSVAYSAMLELGRLQQAGGDVEGALATWGRLLDAAPANEILKQSAHIETGDILTLRGRFSESLLHFERAAALAGPRVAEAYYKAARTTERMGDAAKAGTYALKALAADSGSAFSRPILQTAVRGSMALGQYQQAVRLVHGFEERFPDDPLVPRMLLLAAGLQVEKLHDARQAQRTYERILSEYAGNPVEDDALFGYAQALRKAGMQREAVSALESLLLRFPASHYAEQAEALIFELKAFELKDKEGGLENLALLTGDVIAGKARSDLAFRLAEISFNDLKDYANAATQYRNALQSGLTGERRARAWLRLGTSLERASWNTTRSPGQIADIVSAYDSVSVLSPGSSWALVAFTSKALVLLKSVRTIADARRISENLRKDAPGGRLPAEVVLGLAKTYQSVRSYHDAATVLAEFLRSRPEKEDEARGLFLLALSRWEMGDKDSAGVLLKSYLTIAPAHRHAAKALSMLAILEGERGRKDPALELCGVLEREFSYADEAAAVDQIRGDVLYSSGDFAGAKERYERVLADIEADHLNPRTPPLDLILKLADCARRSGSNLEAKKYYAHALAADTVSTNRGWILTLLAEIAREENNIETAARYLQEASKLGSDDPARQFHAALESANLIFEAEDYASAAGRYGELESKAATDSLRSFIQARMIVCYFRLENPAEAERRAAAFVKRFPSARAEAASFEYERGRLHLRKDEIDLAGRRFENVRNRYPQAPVVPEAVYWLARTYEMRNDPQRAIQLYDSLLKAFPSHPVAPRTRLSLGNVYYGLEQWDAAARVYKTVAEDKASPADVVQYATSNLIMAYKEIGLFDAALQLTREYIMRYPNDPDLILKQIDIGVIYQKLGYYDQSILHLQKLLETADKELEGELRYYIGEAYFNKGEYQQAILEFLKVPYLITQRTKVDWIATSYYMAGQSYEKMSKFDQAITMYRQIIDRPGIDPTFKSAAQKEIDRVNTLVNQK